MFAVEFVEISKYIHEIVAPEVDFFETFFGYVLDSTSLLMI